MEQGLLNYYFSDALDHPGGTSWTRIPIKYNVQWLTDINRIQLENLTIIHDKFWLEDSDWHNPKIQQLWWNSVLDLQMWQIKEYGSSCIEYRSIQNH